MEKSANVANSLIINELRSFSTFGGKNSRFPHLLFVLSLSEAAKNQNGKTSALAASSDALSVPLASAQKQQKQEKHLQPDWPKVRTVELLAFRRLCLFETFYFNAYLSKHQ